MSQENNTPNERLLIEIGGEEKVVFMSFGLVNSLVVPMESVDHLHLLDSDPDLRNFVLTLCLSPRDEKGKILHEYPLFNLSYAQGEEILSWVREHITDFFITRLVNKLQIQKKVNQAIAQP